MGNVYFFLPFGTHSENLTVFQRYYLGYFIAYAMQNPWTFYFGLSIKASSDRGVISKQINWTFFILVDELSLS